MAVAISRLIRSRRRQEQKSDRGVWCGELGFQDIEPRGRLAYCVAAQSLALASCRLSCGAVAFEIRDWLHAAVPTCWAGFQGFQRGNQALEEARHPTVATLGPRSPQRRTAEEGEETRAPGIPGIRPGSSQDPFCSNVRHKKDQDRLPTTEKPPVPRRAGRPSHVIFVPFCGCESGILND